MKQTFSELQLILKLKYSADKPNTVIDVGAHMGSFSMPFARAGWRAIAFEPENSNYQDLCRNLKDLPNVTCIKKAVSNVSGEKIPFYTSSEHWGIHSLKPFHSTHQPSMTVETVRLDEILSELQISYVTILKIDVEGADFNALKSFDFNRFQPEVVVCEFMDERSVPNYGYTHHDMVDYMTERGYAAFVCEWSPIVEYGRKGVPSEAPHRFLQCVRYPIDHEPAWGNIIFVPKNRIESFEHALSGYLNELEAVDLKSSPGASSSSADVTKPWNRITVPIFRKDTDGAILPNFVFHRTWDNVHSRCVEYPWVASRYRGEQKIIDVGSAKSNQEWLQWLDNLNSDVTLIDLDAPEKGYKNITFKKANLMAMPFKENSFDIIMAVSVMEHIGLENPQVNDSNIVVDPDGDIKAFAELIRVLKPGGRLLTTLPYGPKESIVLGGSARMYDAKRYRRMGECAKEFESEYYQYQGRLNNAHFGRITWVRIPPEETSSRMDGHTDGVICTEWIKE